MQTDSLFSHPLQNRIKTLDGFRGLAIILVMGYHYFTFFSAGWAGVDLFFVLSGFLITGKLVESAGSSNYFAGFYWRRLLRIVPLYYLILLVFFILVPLAWPSPITASYQQLINEQAYYWAFSINVYNAVQGWTENVILVPLWSIACEMQFYCIWPLVVLLVLKKRQWAVPALTGCLLFAIAFRLWGGFFLPLNAVYRYVLFPSRMDSFSTGAILYFFIHDKQYGKWLHADWILATICIAAAVCLMGYSGQKWAFGSIRVAQYGYTLNALFWGSIIGLALRTKGWLSIFFQSGWLRAAGKYSYGMYLFHIPVKVLIGVWCKVHFFSFNMNYLGILFLVVTAALAFISYHLLEKRVLYFKRIVNIK